MLQDVTRNFTSVQTGCMSLLCANKVELGRQAGLHNAPLTQTYVLAQTGCPITCLLHRSKASSAVHTDLVTRGTPYQSDESPRLGTGAVVSTARTALTSALSLEPLA